MDPRLQLLSTAVIALIGNAIAVYTIVSNKQEKFKDVINNKFERVILESNNKFTSLQNDFNKMAMQLNKLLEGDLRVLQVKLERFELGQDEWTKTLRERTHSIANEVTNTALLITELKGEVNLLKLRVDTFIDATK